MTPEQWLNSFLSQRTLRQPDRRWLCSYRCSDDEYLELRNLLRGQLAGAQSRDSTAPAFCLFAAEHIRRDFSGGRLRWEYLFADALNWRHPPRQGNEIADFVTNGLRWWRREVLELPGSRRYLSTLVAEGGLPLNLLRYSDTSLFRLLSRVLDSHERYGESVRVANLVSLHQNLLPGSFRRDSIYELIGELVSGIARLRKSLVGWSEPRVSTPTQYLDATHPDWQNQLPINLDTSLSDQLLVGLLSQPRERHSVQQCSVRRLVIGKQLVFEIDLPTEPIPLDVIGASPLHLPPVRCELRATINGEDRLLARVRRDEQNRLHFHAAPHTDITAKPEAIYSAVALRLQRQGRVFHEWTPPGGSRIDHSLPLIFVQHRDDQFRLAGSLASRVLQNSAIILVPPGWETSESVQSIKPLLSRLNGQWHQFSGEITLTDNSNTRLTIKTGVPVTDEVWSFDINNRIDWLAGTLPIFCGVPAVLHSKNEKSQPMQQTNDAEVRWRRLQAGQGRWFDLAERKPSGPVEIQATVDGQPVVAQRAIVLDDHARAEVKTISPVQKAIHLIGTGATMVAVRDEPNGLSIHSQQVGANHVIDLKQTDSAPSPNFKIALHWAHGSDQSAQSVEALMATPFAWKGFVDAARKPLQTAQPVSLARLYEFTAIAINPVREQARLTIARGRDRSDVQRQHVDLESRNAQYQLPLIYLLPQIEQIIGRTGNLRESVNLSFVGNNQPYVRVQYCDHLVRIDNGQFRVFPEDGSTIATPDDLVCEVRSYAGPGHDIHRCTFIELEQVWQLPEISEQGSPWAVFVWRNGKLIAPPRLIIPKNHVQSDSSEPLLLQAIRTADAQERDSQIKTTLARLPMLESHLREQELEILQYYLEAFEGVPPSAFDLLNALCEVPDAMALTFLASTEASAIRLLAVTNELPLDWNMVPVASWTRALEVVLDEVSEGFRSGVAAMIKRQMAQLQTQAPPLSLAIALFQQQFLTPAELMAIFPEADTNTLCDHTMAEAARQTALDLMRDRYPSRHERTKRFSIRQTDEPCFDVQVSQLIKTTMQEGQS